MNPFPSAEERSKLLLEAITEIKKTKEGAENPVQQGEVSSSKPTTLANDVLGPLLLDALDGFLFVINSQGRLVFVSENVEQFLGSTTHDLIGKSIYNIVAVRDHLKFSNSLLPLTSAGSSAGNGSPGSQLLSAGNGKNKVFTCRMIVKPVSANGSSDTKACSYEDMHISAALQPFPCDQDSDLSEEKQSCLVCIARRMPLSEVHSPYSTGPQTSEIFAATAAAISGGMLGREQFITKEDTSGRILDCNVSYLTQSQYQPSDFVGKVFQELCHPNDTHLFTRHLQEVLKKGSDKSPVYRFRLSGTRFVYLQSKSVLAAPTQPSYSSSDSLATAGQPTVISSHTVIRDCDTKVELKGTASSSLMKSIILNSATAVTPLNSSSGGSYVPSQAWPSPQYPPPPKGLLAGSSEGWPGYNGLPSFESGAMPDVNFNEYFSSSLLAGSSNSSSGGSSDSWDVLGGIGPMDNNHHQQQHFSHQGLTQRSGSVMLHAKVQPLPSAIVLPRKPASALVLPHKGTAAGATPSTKRSRKKSSVPSGCRQGSSPSNCSAGNDSSTSSPSAALQSPSAGTAPAGGAGGSDDLKARSSSPEHQHSVCDAAVLRELLSSADTISSQGGGDVGDRCGPRPAAGKTSASGIVGSYAQEPEPAASPTTTSAGTASGGSAPESHSGDDATLRRLLSANDAPSSTGSGELSLFPRPSSGFLDADDERNATAAQSSDGDHTLLKKLLTDDDASTFGHDKSREKGGLLQILLKDEHDEAHVKVSRQSSSQDGCATSFLGATSQGSTSSGGPAPKSRPSSRRGSTAASSSERHPSGSTRLTRELNLAFAALYEKDARQAAEGKGQKRKLSASGEIDSTGGDGLDATGGCRSSVLLNQLLQNNSGPRQQRLSGGPGDRGPGSSVGGGAARNPQDLLPKDSRNYMVDVRVTRSGEPVLLFGGEELMESNMDRFAQITKRYGQYSDKDGSSVVGWLPGDGGGRSAVGVRHSVDGAEPRAGIRSADAGHGDANSRTVATPSSVKEPGGHDSFLTSLYSEAATGVSGGVGDDFDGSSTSLLSQINEMRGADDDMDFVAKIDGLLGLNNDKSRGPQPKSSEEQRAISAIEQQLRSMENCAPRGGPPGNGIGFAAARMQSSQQLMSATGLAAAPGCESARSPVVSSLDSPGGMHGQAQADQRQTTPAQCLPGQRVPYPAEYTAVGSSDRAAGPPQGLRHPHLLGVSMNASSASQQSHAALRAPHLHSAGAVAPSHPAQQGLPPQQKNSQLQATMAPRPKELYLPSQPISGQQHPMAVHGQYHAGAYGDHMSPIDYGSGCVPPGMPPQRADMVGQPMPQMMVDTGAMSYMPSPQQQLLFQREGTTSGVNTMGLRAAARAAPILRTGAAAPPTPSSHVLQRQKSYSGRSGLAAEGAMPYSQLAQEAMMFGGNGPGPVYPMQQQMPPPMPVPVVQRQMSAPAHPLAIGGSGRPYDCGGMMLPVQQQGLLHSSAGDYGLNPEEGNGSVGPAFVGPDYPMLDSIAEQSSMVPQQLASQQQQAHAQHLSSQYVRQELRAMCSARSQQQQQQLQQQQQQQLPSMATNMETNELPQDILDQISELSSEHFAREMPQHQQPLPPPPHAMWPAAEQQGSKRRQQQQAQQQASQLTMQQQQQASQLTMQQQQQASQLTMQQLQTASLTMQQPQQSQGASYHHMQASASHLQQLHMYQQQSDLQGGQQQQQLTLTSVQMSGYGSSGAQLQMLSPQQHASTMLQGPNSAGQQHHQMLPSPHGQTGVHQQQLGSGSFHTASGSQMSAAGQQTQQCQQQAPPHHHHQQQPPGQQEAVPSEGSGATGFIAARDATTIIMHQKEEARKRKEQFKHIKGSFPELFKSQLCQLASPTHCDSGKGPEVCGQQPATSAQADKRGTGTAAQRPLVPAAVSVLQSEPRTPIEDIRPADQSNSLLQKLLSE